jgi:uracil-DNA glycosylase
MLNNVCNGWRQILQESLNEERLIAIEERISQDIRMGLDVYPPRENIFEAFKYFEPDHLRVCIIGQDCYHGPGEANGLAFSVSGTQNKLPPSLRNIFAELESVYGVKRIDKDLHDWAAQGVLLLNRALTVRHASPNSHAKLWAPITEQIVRWINANCKNVVFMLWGNDARKLAEWIDKDVHLVLEHTHPSPLSRKPFVGCGHFNKCNHYLIRCGHNAIKWV